MSNDGGNNNPANPDLPDPPDNQSSHHTPYQAQGSNLLNPPGHGNGPRTHTSSTLSTLFNLFGNPTTLVDFAAIFQQLGQMMTNLITDVILHTQAQSATPVPESCDSEPKANPPTEFDGTAHKKLETYITECKIMFTTSPCKHRSESLKILAAGSYLKGNMKKWFSNFFLLPIDECPAWFSSWEEFKAELRRCWGLEDPKGAAKADL
jgi:hypothetical protein